VEAEDVDAVLSIAPVDDVAQAWCSYESRGGSRELSYDDPDWWAIEFFMMRGISTETYRRLLLALCEYGDDSLVGIIGAGPLENFVSDDEEDLAWLESQATRLPRLRAAFANVWAHGEVSEQTMLRLDRIAGIRLPRRKF